MRKILYIIDNKARPEAFLGHLSKNSNNADTLVYLCPITLKDRLVNEIKKKVGEHARVQVVPFITEFHKNAFVYKDKFLKFLSDFSSGRSGRGFSARKYFVHPFYKKFSLWWISLIEEKNTLKKQSYHNLARLITIVNFIKNLSIDELYINIENKPLIKALKRNKATKKIYLRKNPRKYLFIAITLSCLKAFGYLAVFTIRKCILGIYGIKAGRPKAPHLKKVRFLFVTYFPYANKDLLRKRVFKNKYFEPLQTSVEKRHAGKTAWLGILPDNSGINLEEIRL